MRAQHGRLLVPRSPAQGGGKRLGGRVPVGERAGGGGALGNPGRMLRHVAEASGELGDGHPVEIVDGERHARRPRSRSG